MITLHACGRVHPMVHGLTRDLRVQWALQELELPYQVRCVDHTGGEMTRTVAAYEARLGAEPGAVERAVEPT